MALYLGNQRVSPNMITTVSGVIPSGTKNITDTSLTDVSLYQYAQVSDGNLVAENIKKDVSILGITGTLEATTPVSGTLQITSNGTFDVSDKQYAEVNVAARLSNPKTVVPSAASQTVLPDQGDDGLSQVTVSGDSNLVAGNIKKDVSIFGVTGTLESSIGGPDAGKLKLGKPICAINWDTDTLAVIPNPYTSSDCNLINYIKINDTIETQTSNYIQSTSSNSGFSMPVYGNYGSSKNLAELPVGSYTISAYTKFDSNKDISLKLNKISYGLFEKPIGYLDSDYSDEIVYERWNYSNNLTDLGLKGSISGILNNHKYDAGTLINYLANPSYNYNLAPSGTTNKPGSVQYDIIICREDGDSLVYDMSIDGTYCSSFAKISFTLEEEKEVKVKYQINKSTSSTPTILIGAIDKNYTSFSYYNKLSNPVVSFSTTTDFAEKEYSFGTLAAGDHFYFIQFYVYSSTNSWSGSITPVFEKTSLNKYLPADINVVSENGKIPEYTYDPYTGEFSIPMVGNITMSAIGADVPVLDKLLITPSNWDVDTSILAWDYPVTDAVYHIETPDGQEYITTEKQYNLTGKLGEASADYKKVKIWATKDSQQSGKCIINLIYNPESIFFNQLNQIKQKINISNSLYFWNYKDDVYLAEYSTINTLNIHKWDYTSDSFLYHFNVSLKTMSINGLFTVDNILYVNSEDHIYAIDIEAKTSSEVLYTNQSGYRLRHGIQRGNTLYWWDSGRTIFYCNKDLSDIADHKSVSGSLRNVVRISSNNDSVFFMDDVEEYIYKLDEENKTLSQLIVDGENFEDARYIIETDNEYRIFKSRSIVGGYTNSLEIVDKSTLTTKKRIQFTDESSMYILRSENNKNYFISFNDNNTYPLYYVNFNADSIKFPRIKESLNTSHIPARWFGSRSIVECILPEYNGMTFYMVDLNFAYTVI